MDKKVFDSFRRIVYEKSGIALGDHKEALVSARVGKRMRALGVVEFRDYLRILDEDATGNELVQLIDAISTNVTSFYREPVHFDFLAKQFAHWREQGQQRFRFWSAACSTGEEPYTIAMTLLEAARGNPGDVRILATDISTKVLEKCREGVYAAQKMEGVPAELRKRYFEQHRSNGSSETYAARQSLKSLITFTRLNLSTPPFPMKGPMDCVFCRNVMIYFDNEVRRRLLAEIHRLLKPGGFLMVGHAESLTGLVSTFEIVAPSIYVKH